MAKLWTSVRSGIRRGLWPVPLVLLAAIAAAPLLLPRAAEAAPSVSVGAAGSELLIRAASTAVGPASGRRLGRRPRHSPGGRRHLRAPERGPAHARADTSGRVSRGRGRAHRGLRVLENSQTLNSLTHGSGRPPPVPPA